MLGTARFIHELSVHVTRRGHDGNDTLPLFIEKESSVTDFGTWQQEVVHGTEGIHGQVINLFFFGGGQKGMSTTSSIMLISHTVNTTNNITNKKRYFH